MMRVTDRTNAGAVLLALTIIGCGGRPTTGERKESVAEPPPASGTARESAEAREKASPSEKPEKADSIELSSEAQNRLGIGVTAARESPLAVALQVPGTVQANEAQVSHVRPLARGRVQSVRVKIGDRVTQGDALAEFDNIEAGELATQYDAAKAELTRLQAQLATATRQAERSRKLAEIGAAPQKEADASISDQKQVEASVQAQQATIAGMETRLRRYGLPNGASGQTMTTVRSPLTGVVTHVSAAPGEVVESSTELFTIADLSRVYVQAQVFEKDLGQARVGQIAAIKVDAYPDQRFTGKVVTIGDVIDAKTRTASVRCDVANSNGLLKLDMFATVELPTAAMRPALSVPADAVQSYEGKSVVFVRSSPTQFTVRSVEVGRTVGETSEITSGLKAGESVVTRAAFQVKSALLAKELGEKDDDKGKKE